jgi:hypothetical protein
MAVTITRTSWIDDDGTGTSGTVINNAEKTTIYNQIDAALAQLAQLAGGNTFTGNQSVTSNGRLFVNSAANPLDSMVVIAANGAVNVGISIQNTNAGNTLGCIYFINSANGSPGNISQTGVSSVAYNTTSDARLKRDHGPATTLDGLRGVVVHDFTWIADGVRDRGVFAQEAHAHYPRAITPGDDATTTEGSLAHPWMTDYSKFVPDLIVGWQQHDAEIAALRALLAPMKGSL